jgi:hypothetical protein
MRNMKHFTTLAVTFMLATAGTAEAGGQEGTIGVGAEFGIAAILDGGSIGGASLNYDAGMFHVGGFIGFADPEGADNSAYSIGGRFFYHVHSMASSDFSVGGQLGILSVPSGEPPPDDDRATLMYIEPGIQVRAFLATNVALSFNVGLVIGAIDTSGLAIGGLPSGSAGFHYYFF